MQLDEGVERKAGGGGEGEMRHCNKPHYENAYLFLWSYFLSLSLSPLKMCKVWRNPLRLNLQNGKQFRVTKYKNLIIYIFKGCYLSYVCRGQVSGFSIVRAIKSLK